MATTDRELEGFLAVLAARRAPRTVEAYRRDLTHMQSRLGKPVSSAATDDLNVYLAELRADGLSPATISRRISAARSFFAHQVMLGERTDNPAAELEAPRRRRTLPRTLSPREAERLIEAAAGTTPRALRDAALIELLYGAGLRVSEAVGLERPASISTSGSCAAPARAARSASCRSGAPQRTPCAATSRAGGRTSTAATGPSCS